MILFIYLQREGKGGRMRGRETSMWERNIDLLLLICISTRDRTHNLGMYSDRGSNWWPFTLCNDIQPTESPCSGLPFEIILWQMFCKVYSGVTSPQRCFILKMIPCSNKFGRLLLFYQNNPLAATSLCRHHTHTHTHTHKICFHLALILDSGLNSSGESGFPHTNEEQFFGSWAGCPTI